MFIDLLFTVWACFCILYSVISIIENILYSLLGFIDLLFYVYSSPKDILIDFREKGQRGSETSL